MSSWYPFRNIRRPADQIPPGELCMTDHCVDGSLRMYAVIGTRQEHPCLAYLCMLYSHSFETWNLYEPENELAWGPEQQVKFDI